MSFTQNTDISAQLNYLISTSTSGIVTIPAGNYIVNTSIDLLNKSNITLEGKGIGITTLKATSELNGSDHVTKNNVINVNNLSIPHGSYPKNVTIRNMSIDCSLQNPGGIPSNALYGYNLCGVEIQNVDNAVVDRVEVINAFGNGIVIASIDPLLSAAVINPVITNCILDNVCRGILPQYGITGSVIQVGAAKGGRVSNNHITNSGAPWIDAFNCYGVYFDQNYVEGINNTPFGPGQKKGAFHSDFGLDNCFITNNFMLNAGGIIINGNKTQGLFFTGGLPTHSAYNCTVSGNKVVGHGTSPYTAPPVPNSNVEILTPDLPILAILNGIATVWINNVQQRLSGIGMRTFAITPKSFLKVVYSDKPSWVWRVAPNLFVPHYRLLGGSTSTILGQACFNQITNNTSECAPSEAFACYDGFGNDYKFNKVLNCGHSNGRGIAFAAYDSRTGAVGTGSKNNNYLGNTIFDTHDASMLFMNFYSDSINNVNNSFKSNKLQVTMSGTASVSSVANALITDNY